MDDDVVYVGDKDPGVYGFSVNTILEKKEVVFLRARGRAIVKAINVSEFMKKKGIVEYTEVILGSTEFEGKEGQMIKISTIQIGLKKVLQGGGKRNENKK